MYYISQEISTAYSIYYRYGQVILKEDHLSSLITRYQNSISISNQMMNRLGVNYQCTRCAIKTGSCCFEDIENCYDWCLLLINILMDWQLPDSRELDGTCYFLGRKGCKLLARYSFCINYLCSSLKLFFDQSSTNEFFSTVGKEVYLGWMTECTLRKWVADQG